MVPAAPIMVDFISFGFLPNLVRASKVTDDVHQVIVCVYVFYVFSLGCISLHAALSFSFHSVSFVVL